MWGRGRPFIAGYDTCKLIYCTPYFFALAVYINRATQVYVATTVRVLSIDNYVWLGQCLASGLCEMFDD